MRARKVVGIRRGLLILILCPCFIVRSNPDTIESGFTAKAPYQYYHMSGRHSTIDGGWAHFGAAKSFYKDEVREVGAANSWLSPCSAAVWDRQPNTPSLGGSAPEHRYRCTMRMRDRGRE